MTGDRISGAHGLRVSQPGTILAQRHKGAVTWQARISHDRGRLEVVGIVQPSATPTTFALLEQHELLELLGEGADLDSTNNETEHP